VPLNDKETSKRPYLSSEYISHASQCESVYMNNSYGHVSCKPRHTVCADCRRKREVKRTLDDRVWSRPHPGRTCDLLAPITHPIRAAPGANLIRHIGRGRAAARRPVHTEVSGFSVDHHAAEVVRRTTVSASHKQRVRARGRAGTMQCVSPVKWNGRRVREKSPTRR